MNNNKNLSLHRQIEEISFLTGLVSSSISAISNSVYYSNECKEDNSKSLSLVKITVDNIKEKLDQIWKELPKDNNE